ncbi:MAG: prolipoprotein diacylglyceryl transferase [Pseudomonadota bacterium]
MIFALPFPSIDPELFSITVFGFELALRWYALAYIAGIVLGWWLVVRMVKRPALWGSEPPLTPALAEALLTWMVLGVVLGGRLGFVLFYQFDHYRAHPGEILQVWQGGMSFHGGFLGVVLALILFSLKNGLPMVRVGDAVAAVAPIGILFGRLANFINGELWGRPTMMPWGVVFPDPGAQICAERFGEICARHPSQIYEAVLEGAVLGLVLLWGITRRRWLAVPGRTIGIFLIGYGLGRTLAEGFRQADAQFITEVNPFGHIVRLGESPEAWGLTMGQVLSLPMILAGLVVLTLARRAVASAAKS